MSLSDDEQHDLRVAIGISAMGVADAMDDSAVLDALTDVWSATERLIGARQEQEMATNAIASMVVSSVIPPLSQHLYGDG